MLIIKITDWTLVLFWFMKRVVVVYTKYLYISFSTYTFPLFLTTLSFVHSIHFSYIQFTTQIFFLLRFSHIVWFNLENFYMVVYEINICLRCFVSKQLVPSLVTVLKNSVTLSFLWYLCFSKAILLKLIIFCLLH